ncbi:bromodomain-containing protein DDB_G0280777-like [Teleopsis dalmanni]|uniref:bromodomain-containing protein DDB_G0280777-like n=1 Tax=Teleopsis dalmanni TaxID=139649 RepID=UPI0018CCAD94|nr:bromodomain-containing protein DDB_G0280777-like [Teleopsis dalmanni]XP_037959381.1 bromodomain-containing protein DDB_G0280777-like [Teleopsis dalmanni]
MYLLELQKLMRHAGLNQESQLERVYRNMSTEYQVYIKRRNFTCLKELIALAEDFEELREEQNEVSRARDSEVIFGRVAVECARPLIIQKTMRRIANTPKCDKIIHSPVSKSPFRSQQQHQPIAKQTPAETSRIFTSTTAASISTQSVRHRNDAEQHHVSPQDRKLIPENPKIIKQQRVPQEQEPLQVQLKQMQQEQDPMQVPEVQQEQSPKVKEMSAEYCQPRVIQKQEILQVQMKQVTQQQDPRPNSVQKAQRHRDPSPIMVAPDVKQHQATQEQAAQHQDLKHIKKQIPEIPRQPNPKFNEMPAEFGQQLDIHEHVAQQQDSRPSSMEEVQRHRSASPINVPPGPDGKQLLDTPEHAVQEVFNISQEQPPSKTSLIPWKQKDKIIKTNSTKGQIYDEILSLTQSLPLTQLPQQKEKTIRLLKQVGVCYEYHASKNPPSIQSRQQQVKQRSVFQQDDHHTKEQHDFYKIYKSPKQRHRNHAGR